MAAPAQIIPITKLPPGPVRPELESQQHLSRGSSLPVSADFRADGEVDSNGLDWSDYGRMSTHQHKLNSCRKYPTPEWAMSPDKTRAVLLRYLEQRAFLYDAQGTDTERLERVKRVLIAQRAPIIVTMRKLAKKYVALKTAGGSGLRTLAIQIENLDTRARCLETLAEKTVRIVQLYYGAGLDSVGVGLEVGLKPPQIRQVLHRLNSIWLRLQNPAIKWRRTNKKFVDVKRAQRMLGMGKTSATVCVELGICQGTLLRALRRAGLYPAAKSRCKIPRKLDRPAIVQMFQAGKSVPEITLALGFKGGTGRTRVIDELRKAGVYIKRPRHR